MSLNKKFLKKIKGDASFINFYTKKNGKKSSIIIYVEKEKKKKFTNL